VNPPIPFPFHPFPTSFSHSTEQKPRAGVAGQLTDSHVETVLSSNLDHVLVGANTGGFESLGGELFILVGDEMDAEWEVVDTSTLTAQVEDTDLCVWHTSVEAGLWVWLVYWLLAKVLFVSLRCRFQPLVWDRREAEKHTSRGSLLLQ
jgi:hypothetical protein